MDWLTERTVGPTFLHEPHCVYCGLSLFRGHVCSGHSDLPALDDDGLTARQMREWWLANYSREQIVELAQGLAA